MSSRINSHRERISRSGAQTRLVQSWPRAFSLTDHGKKRSSRRDQDLVYGEIHIGSILHTEFNSYFASARSECSGGPFVNMLQCLFTKNLKHRCASNWKILSMIVRNIQLRMNNPGRTSLVFRMGLNVRVASIGKLDGNKGLQFEYPGNCRI